MDIKIINNVLRKFLTAPRQPKYLNKEEYKHLQERNKEIYLSSCWYKSHWSWEKLKAFYKSMVDMKSYFVCGLPYYLSIKEGLLMKEQVADEMSEADFDKTSFDIEMGCMFFGESEKAYFKLNEFQKNRKLLKPFYPLNNLEYITLKNKNKNKNKDINLLERKEGEIRIIGVDVAMMGGVSNDNSIFTCMRLFPINSSYYLKEVVYIESSNGGHSEIQAIQLKRLFNDFNADYVIMDCGGNGIGLYDACAKVLYDKEREEEYEAWKAYNDEKMAVRALSPTAIPIVYSIKVTQSEVNHEIATWLRDDLQREKLRLLCSELDAKDFLSEKKDFLKLNPEEQLKILNPYIQTTFMINESISMEWKQNGNYVKVFEVGKRRKDRYSSLAYANYLARLLEKELHKDEEDPDDDFIYFG